MIEKELEFFRATRGRTLNLVRCLSQAQMNYRPSVGKWSIGEVVDHVRRAEEFNRGDLAQLIELQRSGQRAVVRETFEDVNISVFSIPKPVFALFERPVSFFGMFLPAGLRDYATLNRFVTLQSPDVLIPSSCRAKEELQTELVASFGETERLLRDNADRDYRDMTFIQPVLGSLNGLELLRAMALHEQRHHQQICEVMISTGFPGAEWPRA